MATPVRTAAAALGHDHQARRRRRRLRVAVKRTALFGGGIGLMAAGMISVPTPVPIGFILFAMGLYFLARGSKKARRSIKTVRRLAPGLSRRLNGMKHRFPRPLRNFIEHSDPGV